MQENLGHYFSYFSCFVGITCEKPNLENGIINPRGSRVIDFDERITFECLQGYKLTGQPTATCEAPGNFSGSLPQCDRK